MDEIPMLRTRAADVDRDRKLDASASRMRSVIACLIIALLVAALLMVLTPPHLRVGNVSTGLDRGEAMPDAPVTVVTGLGRGNGLCEGGVCKFLNVPFAEEFARFSPSRPRATPY